jgi:hypothetical protein
VELGLKEKGTKEMGDLENVRSNPSIQVYAPRVTLFISQVILQVDGYRLLIIDGATADDVAWCHRSELHNLQSSPWYSSHALTEL